MARTSRRRDRSRQAGLGSLVGSRAGRHESRAEAAKPKKEGFLRRVTNHWWDRLISSVFSGSISEQSEQYLAHQTTRDYVCNSIGQAAWGGFFPLLTIVATQFVGAENAGLFSMAMVVGTLRIRGYDGDMTAIVCGVMGFRFFDALGDVYEGRLQQKDKLYLAGISQAVRCVLSFVVFTVLLFITRNMVASSIGMAVGAGASFVLLTLPLALMETERSLPLTWRGVKEIFVNCFPLFLAAFLYNLIDSMPKFAIEGVLSYDNQLYYNAMYFPARLASIWDDPEQHKRFDLIILAMMGVIAGITVIVGLFMGWLGIPVMSFLYGLDFEQFRPLVYVMVVNGGICAAIDFLYQIITVLREQQAVSRLYLIAFAFSVPVLWLLVGFSGLSGAVVGAVVVMSILLVLLLSEYFAIRKRLERY